MDVGAKKLQQGHSTKPENYSQIVGVPGTYLFLSLAKNVSGTQILSAKSPDRVSTSSGKPNPNLSSFQYWFR